MGNSIRFEWVNASRTRIPVYFRLKDDNVSFTAKNILNNLYPFCIFEREITYLDVFQIVSTIRDGSGETARMRSHEPALLVPKSHKRAPTPYSLK